MDDPVLTLSSSCPASRRRGADLLLWWWLVLGIPLAWAKGRWEEHSNAHSWIGVVFTAAGGEAAMTLPTHFVDELTELLKPLASPKGHMPERTLLTIIGKCNRVAQIVPEARPFVGALYAALTGAQRCRTAGHKEAPPGRSNPAVHSRSTLDASSAVSFRAGLPTREADSVRRPSSHTSFELGGTV